MERQLPFHNSLKKTTAWTKHFLLKIFIGHLTRYEGDIWWWADNERQKQRPKILAYSYFSKEPLLVVRPRTIPSLYNLEYLSCICIVHHGQGWSTNHNKSPHQTTEPRHTQHVKKNWGYSGVSHSFCCQIEKQRFAFPSITSKMRRDICYSSRILTEIHKHERKNKWCCHKLQVFYIATRRTSGRIQRLLLTEWGRGEQLRYVT